MPPISWLWASFGLMTRPDPEDPDHARHADGAQVRIDMHLDELRAKRLAGARQAARERLRRPLRFDRLDLGPGHDRRVALCPRRVVSARQQPVAHGDGVGPGAGEGRSVVLDRQVDQLPLEIAADLVHRRADAGRQHRAALLR